MPQLKKGYRKNAKDDREIDPQNMSNSDVLLFLDINPATLKEWVNHQCPHAMIDGRARFNLAKVVKWRIDRAADKSKGKKEEEEEDSSGMPSLSRLAQLNQFEAYRKAKYQNDLTEETMLVADEVKNKFFTLGNMFKSIMKSIVPRISPSLEMKTTFEIEQKLDKEIDESLNQFADLDYDNWGKDGR